MEFNLPRIEEKILKFWKEKKIFEKSIRQRAKSPDFVFYEGPPTANGRPGIHHALARVFKDIICRYKTMAGFKVERRAGWDTHGLPVELGVEKELGLKSKKDIEKYGIAKFNRKCRESVWQYKAEWEKLTERIGFWLDMKNPYITYENSYIEAVWGILKQAWQKELLYQDYKVVPYCPRCGTSLSSHEVAQGYKKVKENSIYVKFKLLGKANTYLLVWTTTPWTLPANAAVAAHPGITYVSIKTGNEILILAKERIGAVGVQGEITEEITGKDLLGFKYEPPYGEVGIVVAADFVSIKEGTGLVHIAPAFGEDDMAVGKKNNLPVILNVDEEGKFKSEVKNWAGIFVKSADPLIIKELKERSILFKEELYEHDYPFCWRCQSELLYYAKQSWFIGMTKLKNELIGNNKKINWVPGHLKEGRFGEWLREVKDWAISRERYWGTPLPIWRCQACSGIKVIGAIKELEKLSGKKIDDPHKPFIDEIAFKCEKCAGIMKRAPEVLDCWFDSGSMPFASLAAPKLFPADYICEGIDQTRGWFYTLLAISTFLGFGAPYKNVISVGHVLDEKGEKMSKSKGNIVSPWDMVEKYGADSVRWYFYTVNQPGESKLFTEKDLGATLRKFIMTFWNCYTFFETYKEKSETELPLLRVEKKEFSLTAEAKVKMRMKSSSPSKNILDKWIISKLNGLVLQVTESLDKYDVTASARAIEKFTVEELSLWHIRRSRKRFQHPETKEKLREASGILSYTLLTLSKLAAPFIPFLSEEIYRRLESGAKQSVHLDDWPEANKKLINKELEEKMEKVRKLVALALAERARAGIKVRQPLASLTISLKQPTLNKDLIDLIKEEINVKEIIFNVKMKAEVELDIKLTQELREEGQVREIIRNIQEARKKANLKPQNKVSISYSATSDLDKVIIKNKKIILKEANLKDLVCTKKLMVDNQKLCLKIRRSMK
jgi:isoleucyl-tRNA synthetase